MASTISYTSKVNFIENQLVSEWHKYEELNKAMVNAQTIKIALTQDNINELSIVKEDMILEQKQDDILDNEDTTISFDEFTKLYSLSREIGSWADNVEDNPSEAWGWG
jgi:hypothetical protein